MRLGQTPCSWWQARRQGTFTDCECVVVGVLMHEYLLAHSGARCRV
jgi:hypothetical protein